MDAYFLWRIMYQFLSLQVVASPSTCHGYNFSVDWWSLGVTAFELKSGGARPFEINQKTSVSTALVIFEKSKANPPQYSNSWSPEFTKFLSGLLTVYPEKRTATLAMAKKTKVSFKNDVVFHSQGPRWVFHRTDAKCLPEALKPMIFS